MAETHPTEPSATVILDSISPAGHRVTTMEVVMHRFVLAEFNTHRAFSRNSASSRAIPFEKMRERVLYDPADPIAWPAEQKGMQGGEELTERDREEAKYLWHEARLQAVSHANQLHDLGVHKSVINRLLEPFLWHTVIVTATDWDNFFALRCNRLAQPEMRAAAEAMQAALAGSEPEPFEYGNLHIPYVENEDIGAVIVAAIEARAVDTVEETLSSRRASEETPRRFRTAKSAAVALDGVIHNIRTYDLYDSLSDGDLPILLGVVEFLERSKGS